VLYIIKESIYEPRDKTGPKEGLYVISVWLGIGVPLHMKGGGGGKRMCYYSVNLD
jgi:hypothetical protein